MPVTKLSEIDTKKSCATYIHRFIRCFDYKLVDLVTFEIVCEKIFKLSEKSSSRAARLLEDLYGGYRYTVDRFVRRGSLDTELQERARLALADEIGDRRALRTVFQTEGVRNSLKKDIAKTLAPTAWRDVMTLEEDMVLLGITPLSLSSGSTLLGAIEAYTSFSTEKLRVLHAPRYVVTFLQGQRFLEEIEKSTLMMAVPHEGSEEVAYAAARLWDPYGGGPLADLRAALKAAETL